MRTMNFAWVAAYTLLLTLCLFSAKINAQTAPDKVIVPAYFFPYDNTTPGQHQVGPYWSRLVNAAATYKNRLVVIANPNNGPGSGQGWEKQKYSEAINKVRQRGGIVLGYVHLCYGLNHNSAACNGRTLADIKSDIEKWKNWYNVDGIFFDEAPTATNRVQWIKDLDTYVKSKFGNNRMLVNNYGTMPAQEHLNQTSWTNLILENKATEFDKLVSALPQNYTNGAVLIHTMNAGTWQSRRDKLRQKKVGYYYITTDGTDWNPWDSLPSFFEQLFD